MAVFGGQANASGSGSGPTPAVQPVPAQPIGASVMPSPQVQPGPSVPHTMKALSRDISSLRKDFAMASQDIRGQVKESSAELTLELKKVTKQFGDSIRDVTGQVRKLSDKIKTLREYQEGFQEALGTIAANQNTVADNQHVLDDKIEALRSDIQLIQAGLAEMIKNSSAGEGVSGSTGQEDDTGTDKGTAPPPAKKRKMK